MHKADEIGLTKRLYFDDGHEGSTLFGGIMDIKNVLKNLCEADYMGGVGNALAVAEKYLSQYATVRRSAYNVIGKMEGKSQSAILLDAHIDEIGMMVVAVTDDGFVKVTASGGIDYRMLAGMKVKIYGKEMVTGVFCSVPPHLRGGDKSVPKLDELYIDTGLSEKAKDVVSVGDRVMFKQTFQELQGDFVTAKALDDRAGVAVLLRVAEILNGKDLPRDVYFLFSDQEETTEAGAMTKTFELEPEEAIIVDVTFGNAPDIASDKAGVLGKGAMIGVSPSLDVNMCDSLKAVAKEKGILHQIEVMGRKTGTNADVMASVGSGAKCSLVSVPLRNMHTPVEVVNTNDIESAADIIAEYILSKM